MASEAWADWLGVWRASVPLSGSRNRDAHAARAVIRAAREEVGLPDPRPITLTRERITAHGTVIYRQT